MDIQNLTDAAKVQTGNHPDYVRTSTGKYIKRTQACFMLQQHDTLKDISRSSDGVVYKREVSGQLRRLTPKKSK